jgi:hypothetical protein
MAETVSSKCLSNGQPLACLEQALMIDEMISEVSSNRSGQPLTGFYINPATGIPPDPQFGTIKVYGIASPELLLGAPSGAITRFELEPDPALIKGNIPIIGPFPPADPPYYINLLNGELNDINSPLGLTKGAQQTFYNFRDPELATQTNAWDNSYRMVDLFNVKGKEQMNLVFVPSTLVGVAPTVTFNFGDEELKQEIEDLKVAQTQGTTDYYYGYGRSASMGSVLTPVLSPYKVEGIDAVFSVRTGSPIGSLPVVTNNPGYLDDIIDGNNEYIADLELRVNNVSIDIDATGVTATSGDGVFSYRLDNVGENGFSIGFDIRIE